MELGLVVQPPAGGARDLVVDVDPADSTAELARVLVERLGLPWPRAAADGPILFHSRLDRWLDPAASIASVGLRCGDGVWVAPRRTGPSTDRARTQGRVELAVVGGPDSGRRFVLGDGEHVVGRAHVAAVTLTDPAVSSRHLAVRVTPHGVSIADLGSSNGTTVDGERLATERVVRDHELIVMGHSVCCVRPRRADGGAAPLDQRGRVAFNRPPRRSPRVRHREIVVPSPPMRPRRARVSSATAIAPLLMGLGFFAVSKNPMMLMFMTLSPVIAVWSVVEDRRSGHRVFRAERLAFFDRVELARADVRTARMAEQRERRLAAPDPAELAARVTGHEASVWERRAGDADFLQLRVGLGDLASDLSLGIEPGGCDALRREARAAIGEHATVVQVPVVVSLAEAGGLALSGDEHACVRLAAWSALQLAALHSPRDLAIAAAITAGQLDDWDWLKWLPHTTAESSSLSGRHLALGASDALDLVERIVAMIEVRTSQSRSLGTLDSLGARLVVLLHEDVDVERALVSRLIHDGPRVGVFTLWIARRPRDVPGECGATVDVSDGIATLTMHHRHGSDALLQRGVGAHHPSAGDVDCEAVRVDFVDGVSAEVARRVALALAPVRDVGVAASANSLPRTASLLDLLALSAPTPDAVLERWRRPASGLEAVIGMAADAAFTVDIRHDGPHCLVAGTTGSGKSELLQSMVASLAATHGRDRLTLLLIDYKGGAAFSECVRLPHTVGFVTDLDGRLAHRVLVSLNAEVRRREALLRDAGAKDIVELERREPTRCPPSLVIVIDEFAALVREVPEFVEGVIDVAQRGRSLGLHLVLATQRPNGVVNENIRANTNLRIALRVHDAVDSQDVIGSDDAASIPRFVPGRAYARTGHSELTAFQAAYAGDRSNPARSASGVVAAELVFGGRDTVPSVAPDARASTSDLTMLVDAIRVADEQLALPPPTRPWLPPLPSIVSWRDCTPAVSSDDPARHVVVGLIDEPSCQRRRGLSVDLERDGSVLVFGTSGAGKTTALRAMASALARVASPDELHLYALDFAGRGLESVRALPHCGAVILGDDASRVTRVLTYLDGVMRDRRELLAAAGVATVGEHRAAGHARLPRIVVLLDGYGAFLCAFERVDFGDWVERVHRLVADGRPVGVHFVIAADRRGAVPAALMGAVSTRVVLRMADDDDLVALGVPTKIARGAVLPPGRGFIGGLEIQVALAGDGPGSDDPSGDGEAAAVGRLGSESTHRWGRGTVPGIPALPARIDAASLPAPSHGLRPVVGISDEEFQPVCVDLVRGNFLVAGPPRSGRTTALGSLTASIARSDETIELYAFLPRGLESTAFDGAPSVTVGFDECERALCELAAGVGAREDHTPVVVLIDDATDLSDGPAAGALEELARAGTRRSVRVVAAVDSFAALRSFGGFVSELRRAKHGLLLRPDLEADGDLLGVRLRSRPGERFPPGRGYLVRVGAAELVQTAELAQTAEE